MSSLFPYKHHSGPEGLLRPPLVYSGGWLRACIRAAPQGWQLSEGSQGVWGQPRGSQATRAQPASRGWDPVMFRAQRQGRVFKAWPVSRLPGGQARAGAQGRGGWW